MSARDIVRAMRDPRAALVRRLRRLRVRLLGRYARVITWGDLTATENVQRQLMRIGDRLEALGGYPYPATPTPAAFGTLRLMGEVLPFERATFTLPDGRTRIVFPVPASAPMGAPLVRDRPEHASPAPYRAKRGQRARRGRRQR